MNADILFDQEGAGRYLGGEGPPIAPRTLEHWRQTGEGPRFIRVGKKTIRYRKRHLDEHLESQTFTSTSEADQAA